MSENTEEPMEDKFVPGEPVHLTEALSDESNTGEVFEQLFEETSMTPAEFDAAVAKGEPVELLVRLKPGVSIRGGSREDLP